MLTKSAVIMLALFAGAAATAHAQPEMSELFGKTQPATEVMTRDQLADGLLAADRATWREVFVFARKMAAQPGTAATEVLRENWGALSDDAKSQAQKAWVFHQLKGEEGAPPHPTLLHVLNLGATDKGPKAQQFAFSLLKPIAFKEFANDFSAYKAWYQANHNRPVEDVISSSLLAWVVRLKSDTPEVQSEAMALARDVSSALRTPAIRHAATNAGLPQIAAGWLKPGAPRERVDAAVALLRALKPDEKFIRKHILPAAINAEDSSLSVRVMPLLEDQPWAFDIVLQQLRDRFEAGDARSTDLWPLAQVLAAMGNPRAIPLMIGIIEANNQYETVYGIGHFGLGKLTGVRYDKSHDGAWWRAWWERNKERFPEDVQAMEIPKVNAPAAKPGARAEEPAQPEAVDPELAKAPSKTVLVGGDEKKRYELIGPRDAEKKPAEGWSLLVILPGGSGGADFNPFLRRVALNALPGRYLVAQAVAPVWRDDDKRIVWPTAKLPDDKMAFPTEQFVREIIADVKAKHAINPAHVFLLGWSSGGPPVYTCLTMPNMPVRGGIVAMSVFKPDVTPALEGAKGRAIYLLHSPQDFIKMNFPNDAVEKLTAAGARVKLETYEGGHGWRGDTYGQIRRGIEWLEKPETPK